MPPVVALAAEGSWLTLARDGGRSAHSTRWPPGGRRSTDTVIPSWTRRWSRQLGVMNHVMFGGLTHEPAARLGQLLVDITPPGLETVFFSDSGSVAVEVAAKMALQYWRSRGRFDKHRLMTWRGGYHGDTFTPMSVCDPDGGMHSLWSDVLVPAGLRPAGALRTTTRATSRPSRRNSPSTPTNSPPSSSNRWCRAPVGCASTTRATSADLRAVCDRHDVLLIFDEIATGFGRTGELFAADHAGVSPDIMCVGKALTGGYVTLAATLCTMEIAETISGGAGRRADARTHVHGQRAGLRGVGGRRWNCCSAGTGGPGWARSAPAWRPDWNPRGRCRESPTCGCAARSASSRRTGRWT